MKRAYIIHKWSGNPESDWYPWLKKQLEQIGYQVFVPQMPNNDTPIISERVSFLQNLIGTPDENTLFIGHSIGCQEIMRYLETLPKGAKVAGAVFVAGWFNLTNLETAEIEALAKPWIENPIDFEKIKEVCPKITVLLSSNEPYGYVNENKEKFEQKLNARVRIIENKGHFDLEDNIDEVPEILEFV